MCIRDSFVTVPEKLRDFMEQQILAQYPNAQIDEVPDYNICLLYTSDAADERSSVDLGGRRIIKNKKRQQPRTGRM